MKTFLLIIMILTALYRVTSSQTSTLNKVFKSSGDVKEVAGKNFELYQNKPMEFKDVTAIQFDLYSEGYVNLSVYNSDGKLIETLAEGNMEAGIYTVYYKKGLAQCTYKYTIDVDGTTQSKELILNPFLTPLQGGINYQRQIILSPITPL
ncbi:MAG: hypothetical protein M3P82_05305 [Bacteroidota bacterium]|nr:hypothetical protein [Bacteroidota bacterium]